MDSIPNAPTPHNTGNTTPNPKGQSDWLRLELLTKGTSLFQKDEEPEAIPKWNGIELPGYDILKLLGKGGMGVVYLAQDHALKREVAIKSLTSLGLRDPRSCARFRSESEILARLQHPGIVQIYGAEIHDETPYLMMEYVAGGSLDTRLDEYRTEVRKSVALVQKVARAVQFAHDRGVIHRDLKPANILLNAEGEPKVADFGVAHDLDTGSHLTKTGEWIGTPAYTSPEQLNGESALTPASDVYSLGIILHQMLTGVVPFDADSRLVALVELQSRSVLPLQTWEPSLPKELDTICRKCLRKEPKDRYTSAEVLAEDLGRFLEGQPILARPMNRWEKAQRWCRRHPAVSALSAALLVVVLVALGGLGWGMLKVSGLNREMRTANEALTQTNLELEKAQRETEQKHQAAEHAREKLQTHKKEAEKTLALLVQALRLPDPKVGAQERTVGEFLEKAWKELVTRDDLDPETQLTLLQAIGRTFLGLGEYTEAVRVLEPADQLARDHKGLDHETTLGIRQDLGRAYSQAGQYENAIAVYQQVRDVRVEKLGEGDPRTLATLNNLAGVLVKVHRYEEAIGLYERVRDIRLNQNSPDHPSVLITLNNLAGAYLSVGRTQEAILIFEEVHRKESQVFGAEHLSTLATLNNLAVAYSGAGRTKEAIPLYENVSKVRLERLGLTHPDTQITYHDMGGAYLKDRQYEKAITTYEQLRDARMKVPGPEHWNTLHTLTNLGIAYRLVGRSADAVELHERVLEVRLRLIGPDHPHTLMVQKELALSYKAAGQTEAAVPQLEKLLSAHVKKDGYHHPDTQRAYRRLLAGYEKLQMFDRQESLLREHHRRTVTKAGSESLEAAATSAHLGSCLIRQNKYSEAEEYLQQSLKVQKKTAPHMWTTFRTQSLLGASLLGQKQYEFAGPLLSGAYESLKAEVEQIPRSSRKVTLRVALDRLIELSRARDLPDEVAKWQRERQQWVE